MVFCVKRDREARLLAPGQDKVVAGVANQGHTIRYWLVQTQNSKTAPDAPSLHAKECVIRRWKSVRSSVRKKEVSGHIFKKKYLDYISLYVAL